MSEPRYMNNRVQDLGNNVVSVECPVEYTDGYHVTCGWSEEDGAWIAEVSGVSTGSILADGPTRELAVLALVASCCATLDAVNDSATVAALTAENAQLRETLTLGLGEQESVIAGLRAESERLTRDLATARENYDVMHASWKGLHWELDQLRAALPSSRETAPPPDKTREIL